MATHEDNVFPTPPKRITKKWVDENIISTADEDAEELLYTEGSATGMSIQQIVETMSSEGWSRDQVEQFLRHYVDLGISQGWLLDELGY